jgi:hypothetical protein
MNDECISVPYVQQKRETRSRFDKLVRVSGIEDLRRIARPSVTRPAGATASVRLRVTRGAPQASTSKAAVRSLKSASPYAPRPHETGAVTWAGNMENSPAMATCPGLTGPAPNGLSVRPSRRVLGTRRSRVAGMPRRTACEALGMKDVAWYAGTDDSILLVISDGD